MKKRDFNALSENEKHIINNLLSVFEKYGVKLDINETNVNNALFEIAQRLENEFKESVLN